MASQVTKTLEELIKPVVEGMGFEFVGLEFLQQGNRSLLRVYIDSEAGVNVDHCGDVSYQVSGLLEVEDPIRGQYVLEVSSPGMDRPLFTRDHFQRFAGQRVTVRTAMPLGGRRNFSGYIQRVEGDDVVLVADDGEITIPLAQIDRARLVPDYSQSMKRH